MNQSLRRVACFSVLASAVFLVPSTLSAQEVITIGTGTVLNDFFQYPAPYGNSQNGARHQMLVLASELQAAGMQAGDISSVAFDVATAAFVSLNGFTVSIGSTTEQEMTAAWLVGLTPVWGPTTYADQLGWNTHVFDQPFYWNGTSNLVVQTCFANTEANFNAQFNQSITPFNSTTSRSTPNPNVCTAATGTLIPFAQRPNMRFEWTSIQAPPVAAFEQSTFETCDGIVQFTDVSSFIPTSWAWDFGDSGTDTTEAPLHVYTTDGTYTPVLIVSNAFGSDTVSGFPIIVNANGPRPVAACVPTSTGTVSGFGILSVTIGDHTITSLDAATEGYADRSCQLDTALAGTSLTISVVTGSVAQHNVRVWIDWDNSGDLIGPELVLSANSVFNASATFTVPEFAVLDTPLRIRVMADYDFSAIPEPCVGPQFGQAEDYGLVVLANALPPEATFTASPLFSCDGAVQFTDASLNIPSSWHWDFGDTGTSIETSPLHTYTTSGTYSVELIVTNVNGADTLTITNMITIDLNAQLVPATCMPETQGYCCGFGLTSLQLAGIISSSPDGVEGYVDRSCGNVAQVTEGTAYPISIGTGGTVDHDVIIWMDLDNNGTFDASEEVWSALNQQDPSGTFVMPAGSVYGTALRMRIVADVVGETTSACESPLYGQMEDFAVIVTANPNPPTAAFSASPTNTCNGFVQFTDASLNAPTSWAWTFGDTGTSDQPSPLHQYLTPGVYTVSLTVTNANGSDVQSITNYITFTEPWACDTIQMPGFQDDLSTECQGVLTDDGGPNAPYSPNGSGSFTIAPIGTEVVILAFSQFQWGNNTQRWLAIYDGPDVFSPLIGEFTGNGLAQLPNGGVITSSGSAITLRQENQGGGGNQNSAGFLLTWDCSFTGVAETNSDPINGVWPQPASDELNITFGTTSSSDRQISLLNAMGATVVTSTIRGSEPIHRFDTRNLAAGFYLLSVETSQGRWNRTVVLN